MNSEQTTLHITNDAVITTDADANIEHMNCKAEGLTDWDLTEARGKPVSTVFKTVDDSCTPHLDNPVHQCLSEDRAVQSETNVVFISRSGLESPIKYAAAPYHSPDGQVTGAVLAISDLSEPRYLAELLAYSAKHDRLTGLSNRVEFERDLKLALKRVKESGIAHILCYLDLDQFKVVNDTCGHLAGDQLLRQLASALERDCKPYGKVYRMGGDEFAILMETGSAETSDAIVGAVRSAIDKLRFTWRNEVFRISASIGLVNITEQTEDLAAIMSAVDSALYAAKDAGRNRVQVYIEDDKALMQRHGDMQWVPRINRALEEDRLLLSSQKIARVNPFQQSGEHYEFLIRMQDESGSIVAPGAFLPAAERYNLASTLDRWVVGTAFAWLARNPEHLKVLFQCSINLSGQSLTDSSFLSFVTECFEDTALSPEKICFEITETAAITNFDEAIDFITTLKARGCKFALDDFGSGLSSFAYLKNIPVDILKIDGMFVKDIATDPVDFAMVKSISDLGHMLGMQTVAEFVENDDILSRLCEIGVDYAQGYHIGRPEPVEHLLPNSTDAPLASASASSRTA